MNIYTLNISLLSLTAVVALVIWYFIVVRFKKSSRIMALLGGLVSVYIILSYSVIGRSPSNNHTFVFALSNTNEFLREMFMNALLYIPLGMTISVLFGGWGILIALILSLSIECWQYIMGTGLAQGTDIIMNTLGAFVGSLPFLL